MPPAAAPLLRPNPNFESSCPVRTYSWVWASTPGVTRSSTWGRETLGVEGVEAVQLVEGVDHDAPTPATPRARSSATRLVVAVEHQPVGRHTGGQRHVELAAGGHVEQHALLVGQAGHGRHRNALVA
jgi:hypothetical protein